MQDQTHNKNYKLIFQPNRVTDSYYSGFSLTHNRILLSVINNLQPLIHKKMKGEDLSQLKLFSGESQIMTVKIPFKTLSDDGHYNHIYSSAEDLLKLSVKNYDKEKNIHESYVLFHHVSEPIIEDNNKMLSIEITERSAKFLIEMNHKNNGQPINYTSYNYGIAMNLQSKYSLRLYMLISSWKKKGGFVIDYPELRKKLSVEDIEYKNYNDFKKRVLVPAMEELKNIGDCWFNCAAKEFEVREGRKVVKLNFKIINRKDDGTSELEIKIDAIKNILKQHAKFNASNIEELNGLFVENIVLYRYEEIMHKIIAIMDYINDPASKIINKQKYIIQSLKNEFSI